MISNPQSYSSKLLLILCLPLFFSCLEDANITGSDNIIRSEEIIYISGERVRMLGRVLSFTDAPTDHGFEIASSEDFSAPIVVSNGPLEIPGRFIAEYDGLQISNPYFFRSYMIVEGQTVYGDPTPFNSLEPFVTDFSPKVSRKNLPMSIFGGNFTADSRVLVGGVPATVRKIDQESRIDINIPDSITGQFVDIQVISQTDTLMLSQQFEFIIGRWTKEGDFPNNDQIINGITIHTGDKIYFGLGYNTATAQRTSALWQLDLPSTTWTEIGPFGNPPVDNAYFFSGGFGGGKTGSGFGFLNINFSSWQLNPSGTFSQTASFDGAGLSGAVAVERGDKVYLFGGVDQFTNQNYTVYESDINNISWNAVGTIDLDITDEFPAFNYQDYFYFVLPDGLISRYDLASQISEIITAYPDEINQSSVAQVIGDQVFIGIGRGSRQIFQYDLTSGIWITKNVFPGEGEEFTAGSWVYNEKLYIIRTSTQGRAEVDPRMEIWSFESEAF